MTDIRSIANTTSLTRTGGRGTALPVEITVNVVDSPAEMKLMENAARDTDVRISRSSFPTKRIVKDEAGNIIAFLLAWQRHNGWTLQTIANSFPKLAWATAEYQKDNFPHSKADAAAGGGEGEG